MTEKHDESPGGAAFWAAAALVVVVLILPVLYVLSIGPVVAVLEKMGAGHEMAEVFYAPVIWLHDHTLLKEPLEAYAQMWGWH
jgi:hypothetical protein